MELNKFITESLNSIIKGIKDSQDFASENGAVINPLIGNWDLEKTMTTYNKEKEGAIGISTINFDVAVSLSKEQETGAKGGINVMSLNIGGNLSDKDIKETVSRIKFSINVVLPNSNS